MGGRILTIIIISSLTFTIFLGYYNLETENKAIAEWLPEIELSTDIGAENQMAPSIAVENGKVHVVWHGDDDGDYDIYYRYFDGSDWQPEQKISTDSATEWQASPKIAVEGGKLHVVWRDYSDGDWDIYYKYYNGTDWQPEIEISTDKDIENQSGQEIAVENGKVHVVWESHVDGFWIADIYYRYFNGTDWQPEQEISTDILAEDQGEPSIAVENGKVHVAWSNYSNGNWDIVYRYFNGTDWEPEQEISIDERVEQQAGPSIAVENGKVYIAWTETEDMPREYHNISYRYFDGISWHPEEPIYKSMDISESPVIAVENGKIYVAWMHWWLIGPADYDIFYRYFDGGTWGPIQEISSDISNERQDDPSIAVENGIVHLVWGDKEDGDWSVCYRCFVPPDLEVTVDDIVFDPISPVFSGTDVTINATIHNIGEGNVSNVTVRFYDGDPGDPVGTGPGVQIDVDQFLLSIPAGENRSVQVTWTANLPGIHNIYVVVDPLDIIAESNETNNIASKDIEVIGISPPTLYIEAVGNDIVLNWTQSKTTGVSHYLLYNSTSQTDFNFSDVWINTSQYDDNGVIPLRTTLNDTGAASAIALQKYYTLRTVFDSGDISFTSRTVGKWTKTFPEGVSSFSVPLEPLETLDTYNLTKDMNASYIRWMDPGTHVWKQHDFGDSMDINNTNMILGESYEVKFNSLTNYTFTGMPGAMIIYDNDTGFSGFDYATEAKNLSVSVEPNGNVTLTWEEPASMNSGDWYEVYYSNTRDGFFGIFNVSYFLVYPPVYFGNDTTTHDGANASNAGARLYYMVVPFNASGVRGASTYSIGIWTEEYISEYDTFGIPLKLSNYKTTDWYCDNIPDTVGMNYYIVNEQRWGWHSERMPAGAYDPVIVMTEGYQISTSSATKFSFVGI